MICKFIGGCVDGQRFDVGNADSTVTMHAGMGTNWNVDCYHRCSLELRHASEFIYVAEDLIHTPETVLAKLVGAQ